MSKDITRVIEIDEEIYSPTNSEEKGPFLTRDEQRGIIQLDLIEPLELSDQEPVKHLTVRAPRARDIKKYNSNAGSEEQRERHFFGSCVEGIMPTDLDNLHGADYNRLGKLITNFIS